MDANEKKADRPSLPAAGWCGLLLPSADPDQPAPIIITTRSASPNATFKTDPTKLPDGFIFMGPDSSTDNPA